MKVTQPCYEMIDKIAREVLSYSRNTLIVHLRFLDVALSRFEFATTNLFYLATDGKHFVYNPITVIKRYREEREQSVRDYLHVVLHCVFCHMFLNKYVNEKLWDLACDIAVENIITDFYLSAAKASRETKQSAFVFQLKKNVKYMTAETIYKYLRDMKLPDNEIKTMHEAFFADDHSCWYESKKGITLSKRSPKNDKKETIANRNTDERSSEETDGDDEKDTSESRDADERDSKKTDRDDEKGTSENRNTDERSSEETGGNDEKSGNKQVGVDWKDAKPLSEEEEWKKTSQDWKNISQRIQEDLTTFSKKQGSKAGFMLQNLTQLNRERYDYTDFLKQFAVLGEAMKVNEDEFDYIFYTYGLNLYGKMPLIEPLEYKEVKRIKEFAIVIDTSGSTSGETVQNFLQKTYNILKCGENFFSRINLHIIQCDAVVQEDVKITCQDEFDDYLKRIKIKGLGGTDFRPAFHYVEQLIKNGDFENLKGMVYFTDGFGTFPEHQPPYKTAFVFLDDGMINPNVPVWAIKLILPKEDL